MIIVDFGLLGLIIWIPLLFYCGLKSAGEKFDKFVDMEEIKAQTAERMRCKDPWRCPEGWNMELLESKDLNNRVDSVHHCFGKWHVCLVNKRLYKVRHIIDDDRDVVRMKAQEQFDEWAAM